MDNEDELDERAAVIENFLHSLFAVIGACLEEGDDAEVSVNGITVMTFMTNPIEQAMQDIVDSHDEDKVIETYDDTNVFDLSKWKPKGDKN